MAALISSLPKIGGDLEEVVSYLGPIWIALFTGVVVGWIWRPKWVDSWRHKFGNFVSANFSVYSSSFMSYLSSLKNQFSQLFVGGVEKYDKFSPQNSDYSSPQQERTVAVTRDDLEHLCRLVEVKDGGPAWIQMMDRSSPTMAYQAWRRDAPTGPPQYRSRTVYEDVTPELMRDFFWDDEFRSEWDDMLLKYNTMEECPTTGTMLVHWIRKFPLFCSDREYIIGRRIWESGRSYYCVTKGVPNSVPRRNKPMRVDLYYSSWCIRAVESNRGDGQLTACEVTLFHHEEMGISRELAKLGVKQGMWGAVKKIEPGLRAYQKHRATDAPLSRFAFMAQINTKINADYLRSLETNNTSSSAEEDGQVATSEKPPGKSLPKFLIVGAAVAVACSLDRGLLTKAVIFGVARRFSKVGRTL